MTVLARHPGESDEDRIQQKPWRISLWLLVAFRDCFRLAIIIAADPRVWRGGMSELARSAHLSISKGRVLAV